MTNEDFERTKEFIVQKQAQFATDIVQLREAQAQTERAVTHASDMIAQTGETVTRLENVIREGFSR
jgi:hypothetical protein